MLSYRNRKLITNSVSPNAQFGAAPPVAIDIKHSGLNNKVTFIYIRDIKTILIIYAWSNTYYIYYLYCVYMTAPCNYVSSEK